MPTVIGGHVLGAQGGDRGRSARGGVASRCPGGGQLFTVRGGGKGGGINRKIFCPSKAAKILGAQMGFFRFFHSFLSIPPIIYQFWAAFGGQGWEQYSTLLHKVSHQGGE